ncbi:MAG TPA: HAMP domain-containing sensor histidine kinase [Candidatus Microsaccharimonas sp.]|jgi:signal transduction histidine kinase
MNQATHKGRRLSSRTLTLTFLAIIMTMSIIFSAVLYATSVHELEKRPSGDITATQPKDADRALDDWIGRRSDDSKAALAQHLIVLNIITLVLGAIVSYLLARTALRPIERALNEQDRFISDASHELRTPITAALLSNEVALKNHSLTLAQAKAVLAENVSDIQELKRLSDELLDQTNADRIHDTLHDVQLQKLVHDVVAKNEKMAHEKGIIITEKSDDIAIKTYPKTITKVLTVLIDNAIKYSADASTIVIEATDHDDDFMLRVKDEGIGISQSDQAHIFDRFYRSDASRTEHDGYGLGLSIASGLVKQMKGSITVTSKLGHGSEFIVRIPKQLP